MTSKIEFSAAEQPRSRFAIWQRFWPYIWPRDAPQLRRRIIVALVLMALSKGASLIVPFFLKYAVDELSEKVNAPVAVAVGMLTAYAVVRFLSTGLQYARDAVYVRVGQRAIRGVALDVFRHLHQLALRFHLERRTGGLARAIERGTKSIADMLHFLIFNIAPTLLELIAVAIIFWVKFGWMMVAIMAGCVVTYVAFTAVVTEWRTKLRRAMVERDTKASSRAIDSLLNYETVKYFNNERHEAEHYDVALQHYEDAAVKSEASLALLNIGQGLVTSLCLGGAMIFVALGVPSGEFTVGELVLVNALLMQLFRPLDALGWVYRNVKQGLIDMEYMFGLLMQQREIQDKPDAKPLMVKGGEIRFKDVVFSYEPDRRILHGISFTVPKGRTLAIVGHSGAGKSTLSRILFRFYDICGGEVLIDGQDVRDVTQVSLRRAIGIVPQDTVLFNETIRYNIGYGRPEASDAEVEEAAKQAQIHDFVQSLPAGYDTVVGERGLKLSGGEKQRVAIARTILKDPPILILDEATSALDTKTERGIQASLQDVARNRTTLIIAHRLSTVVDADEIIVIEEGRIIERGHHNELIARNSVYAEMWAEQQEAAARGQESESVEAAAGR